MIKKQNIIFLLVTLIIFFSRITYAETKNLNLFQNNLNKIIENEVVSQFSFSGIASFYNKLNIYIVSNTGIKKIDYNSIYYLEANESLAIVGHHKILILKNINAEISFKSGKINFQKIENSKKESLNNNYQKQLILKSNLKYLPDPFQELKFVHLWKPLALICNYIEIFFTWLNSLHLFGWGFSIILLSLFFKIFILPINIVLLRSQIKVSKIQASLESELEYIKSNYDGEIAHTKFIKAHKNIGVSPFYKLRPLFLTLVPIPFLIAIFNVLGEFDPLSGQSFLWIKDLAYPDTIFFLNFDVPFFGSGINLLPILMTLFTVMGAKLHKNKIISLKALGKQKRSLYFMAFLFLILFYPFPSAMVLYWTFANIWSLLQKSIFKI